MIKLVAFLKRKPGMTREAFLEHWHDRHGPLIAGTPELARHIIRYEQLPIEVGTEGYDGVTIQWLDSPEAFLAFVNEPKYTELVYPDESRFLDRDALVWMVSGEATVVID